jgi:hypothetical protein
MANDNSLLPLHFLVENILNEDVPMTPHAAVTSRVMAAHARAHGHAAEAAKFLGLARDIIEGQNPMNWRDALRANVDLGVELAACGRFAEAQTALERADEVLDKYFGNHNAGGRALIEMIGALKRINSGGCCGCGGCATEVKAAAKG